MTFKTLQNKDVQNYIAHNMKEMGFDSVVYNVSDSASVYITFYNKTNLTYKDEKFYLDGVLMSNKDLVSKGLVYVVRFSTHSGAKNKRIKDSISLQIVEYTNNHNILCATITDFTERDKRDYPFLSTVVIEKQELL